MFRLTEAINRVILNKLETSPIWKRVDDVVGVVLKVGVIATIIITFTRLV